MQSLEQFMAERGGSLTDADLRYLAKVGLEHLLGPAPPTSVDPSPQPHEQTAAEVTPINQLWPSRTVFAVEVFYKDVPCDIEQLEALANGMSMLQQKYQRTLRTLIVGSKCGEEVIAICRGGNNQGSGVWSIFDITLPHDADAQAIYEFNLAEARIPYCDQLTVLEPQVSLEIAETIDEQQLDIIVLCNPTAEQILAWSRHLLPTGFMVMTNAIQELQHFGMAATHDESSQVSVLSIANWYKSQAEAAQATAPPPQPQPIVAQPPTPGGVTIGAPSHVPQELQQQLGGPVITPAPADPNAVLDLEPDPDIDAANARQAEASPEPDRPAAN